MQSQANPQSIALAWNAAAKDLGIQFISPFEIATPAGKEAYIGLVPFFGRPYGTLIAAAEFASGRLKVSDPPDHPGYFCSFLADSYELYDRKLFVATLNDWGWYSEQTPPSWYTGKQDA